MNTLLIVIILVIIVCIFLISSQIEKFASQKSNKCGYYYQFGDTFENSIKHYVNKERQLNPDFEHSTEKSKDMVTDLNKCLKDCGLTKYDYNLNKCKTITSCADIITFSADGKHQLKTTGKDNFNYKNFKDSNYEDCKKKCSEGTNCDEKMCLIKCEQVKKCNFDPTQKFRHIYDCIETCQQSKRNDGTSCSEIDNEYCKKVCTECGDDCGYKDKCETGGNDIKIKDNVVFSRDGTKAKVSWCINKSKIIKPVEFILVLKTNNLDDGDKIIKVSGTWDKNYNYILKNLTPDIEYILTIYYKKIDLQIDSNNQNDILGTSNELKFTPKKKKINSMYLLDSIAQDTKPNIAASYNYCNI